MFKNCTPVKDCRAEINGTFIDYVDFINITMPMYNLVEYSDNYSNTSRRLWAFKRDEVANNSNVTNDGVTLSFYSFSTKQALLLILKQIEQKMEYK